MGNQKLIVLDRDGVLNRMVLNPEHGVIDSPMHPSQVEVDEVVPAALRSLQDAGFSFVIATNQPAAAKGKTTMANLQAVHEEVLRLAQAKGANILGSYVCFHRSEDKCACRKPATGLLEQAFREHPGFKPEDSWMVGDGITDVQAAESFGLKSVFLGPRKSDMVSMFHEKKVEPRYWFSSLGEFSEFLLQQKI